MKALGVSPKRAKAFAKIELKRFNSAYIKLILLLLADGMTITEITEVETRKVQSEVYKWVKKYPDAVVNYINSDTKFNRIGTPAFFSRKNGFGETLDPAELRNQLYQVLIRRKDMLTKEDVSEIIGNVKEQQKERLDNALNITLNTLLKNAEEIQKKRQQKDFDDDDIDICPITNDGDQSDGTGEDN